MEKKKLLLVAISVGSFLALSIGAAILVFVPQNAPLKANTNQANPALTSAVPPSSSGAGTSENGTANPQPSSVDPVSLLKNPGNVPGLQAPPEGTANPNDSFYVNGAGRTTETIISVAKPNATAVPSTTATAPGRTTQQAPTRSTPATPPSTTPTTPPSTAATPAASRPSAAAPGSQTKTPAETRAYNDYWVQTGAFSTTAKAEGVKATLASKGITSIIENREIGGQTLFRVRVGPYTSQSEANYWLSLIKSIDGFEDSQVRQTIR